ncbi:MAG TPA: hypothetical protein VEG32_05115 [Clostridia bacterium]|nr:hypothetical protein [Clostridia bacterium]
MTTELKLPTCPMCGSRTHVVRMAASLTPFERPDREDFESAHFYCQACAHDFVPDVREET